MPEVISPQPFQPDFEAPAGPTAPGPPSEGTKRRKLRGRHYFIMGAVLAFALAGTLYATSPFTTCTASQIGQPCGGGKIYCGDPPYCVCVSSCNP